MYAILGVAAIVGGLALIASRNWSADFHERWNSQFRWTQWATGPKAMAASRIANVAIGIVLVGAGLVLLIIAAGD